MRFMMATKRAAADHGLAKAAGDFPETRYWIGKTRVLSIISALRGAPIHACNRLRPVSEAGRRRQASLPGRLETGRIQDRGQACG